MSDRPRTYNVLNGLMKILAFPDEVQGKYLLVENTMPVGAGAPPNHHAGETEAFYVLEGQVSFMVDGEEFVARAGDFIPVPDGATHAFQVIGESPARMLILNSPGTMHDEFYTGIGDPLPEETTELPEPVPVDIERVKSMCAKVGMGLV